MTNSLVVTGKNKVETNDFNFSLGKSQKWSIDMDLLDDNQKVDLVEKGLAENVFQIKLADVKTEYSDINDEEKPEWIKIEENNFIKVR